MHCMILHSCFETEFHSDVPMQPVQYMCTVMPQNNSAQTLHIKFFIDVSLGECNAP